MRPEVPKPVIVLLLFALAASLPPNAYTAPAQLRFHYTFDPEQVRFTGEGERGRVSVPGWPTLTEEQFPAAPALPYVSKLFLLPPDTKVISVQAKMSDPYTWSRFVDPVSTGPGASGGSPEGWASRTAPGGSAFDELFPPRQAELATQGSYRGIHLARVSFFPIQYLRRAQQLILFRRVEVTLELAPQQPSERTIPRLRSDRKLSREGFEID